MEKKSRSETAPYLKRLGAAAGVMVAGVAFKQPEVVWVGFTYAAIKAVRLLNIMDEGSGWKYFGGVAGYVPSSRDPIKPEAAIDPAPPLTFEANDADMDMMLREASEVMNKPPDETNPT